MKELYFTSTRRRSLCTIRLEYGQGRKKFVLRTFEGNIIGRRVSPGSPKEEIFNDEKELLKKVDDTKKGLLEGRWIMKKKQSFSKPSFLKNEIIDGKFSFEFSVDFDPAKLDEQKTKIEKDFVEKIDEDIEANIRKGDRKKEEL